MTFCLGITVEQGLVAIADTRLVAGNECLVGKKTASYQGPGFSFFVMNSGLRSLRDKALLYFEEAFARQSGARDRLHRVVNLYAEQVRKVSTEVCESLQRGYTMQFAFKVGLLAFDATRLCVADVGFPMDVILYSRDSFQLVEQRFHADDVREISDWWQERMRRAVHDLPAAWVETAFARLTRDELVL